jgi:uncharacterized protein YgiM (DUF1202 family)
VAVLLGALAAAGCRSWKAKPSDHFVFVTAKQVSLRDRVAAVSNRTGTVENGEKLRVLDRSRQWVRVSAPSGDTGWIQEKSVATEATADEFAQLKDENKDDPTVASSCWKKAKSCSFSDEPCWSSRVPRRTPSGLRRKPFRRPLDRTR